MLRILLGVLLAVSFWVFTWQHIEYPKTYNFDEFHYIPAARNFLILGVMGNTEHPPLGKILIAQGMKIAGDNAYGWRLMSSIFGALTLLGLYFWSLLLFRYVSTAVFVTVLTAANQMLYVQSRIAMLDTFMAGFLIWASYLFSFWWRQRDKFWLLCFSGVLFGCAIATKWFAVFPFAFVGALLVGEIWRKDRRRKSIASALGFGLVASTAYIVSFLPTVWRNPKLHFSVKNFLSWQINTWDLQQRVPDTHAYASSWWSWPLELRPIWYLYESLGAGAVREVVLVGNPLLLWGGIAAVLYCAWIAWVKRCPVAREVVFAYAICLFSWAIVPRKLMFFYYYYPAVLILGLAWARVWEEWRPRVGRYFGYIRWPFAAVTAAIFIYFLPILGAWRIPAAAIRAWAWFNRWI